MEKKIKTLATLHARSFSVDLDEVQGLRPEPSRRVKIRHPSAVSVIPVFDNGETLVVKQFRYAIGRETIEFPAGKLDPGEEPLQAANRELMEETGYKAERFDYLLPFGPSIGYSDEIIHIYKATGLEQVTDLVDEAEISQVFPITFDRLKEMALTGEIIDGTTLLALAVFEWMGGGE